MFVSATWLVSSVPAVAAIVALVAIQKARIGIFLLASVVIHPWIWIASAVLAFSVGARDFKYPLLVAAVISTISWYLLSIVVGAKARTGRANDTRQVEMPFVLLRYPVTLIWVGSSVGALLAFHAAVTADILTLSLLGLPFFLIAIAAFFFERRQIRPQPTSVDRNRV